MSAASRGTGNGSSNSKDSSNTLLTKLVLQHDREIALIQQALGFMVDVSGEQDKEALLKMRDDFVKQHGKGQGKRSTQTEAKEKKKKKKKEKTDSDDDGMDDDAGPQDGKRQRTVPGGQAPSLRSSVFAWLLTKMSTWPLPAELKQEVAAMLQWPVPTMNVALTRFQSRHATPADSKPWRWQLMPSAALEGQQLLVMMRKVESWQRTLPARGTPPIAISLMPVGQGPMASQLQQRLKK
eukprot:6489669-Amphidinium_carterae.1